MLSDDEYDLLLCAATRKREDREARSSMAQLARQQRVSHTDRMLTQTEDFAVNTAHFMDLPDAACIRERYCAFRASTGNEATEHVVCLACSRRLWKSECEGMHLTAIPNCDKLKSAVPHSAHELFNGMLLSTEYIEQTAGGAYGFWCLSCLTSLRKNKTPKLALANGMWIGRIPTELAILTLPEQMLIALRYTRCHIHKLYPKDGGSTRRWDPERLQSALVGNVTVYPLNIGDMAHMIDGTLLPRQPQLLASIIGITFIGKMGLQKHWLKNTFRVRRQVVFDALHWLKVNNPLYATMQISEERLRSLPEDDVPSELLQGIRVEEDDSVALRERAGYVPQHDEIDVEGEEDGSDVQDEREVPSEGVEGGAGGGEENAVGMADVHEGMHFIFCFCF